MREVRTWTLSLTTYVYKISTDIEFHGYRSSMSCTNDFILLLSGFPAFRPIILLFTYLINLSLNFSISFNLVGSYHFRLCQVQILLFIPTINIEIRQSTKMYLRVAFFSATFLWHHRWKTQRVLIRNYGKKGCYLYTLCIVGP